MMDGADRPCRFDMPGSDVERVMKKRGGLRIFDRSDHALSPDLDVQPQDIHETKNRFGAYIFHASDFPAKLMAVGIRNVCIAGTVTEFCCESSARNAMTLDYKVAMVFDCNAARYVGEHNIGLPTPFQSFGYVLSTDEVIKEVLLGGGND